MNNDRIMEITVRFIERENIKMDEMIARLEELAHRAQYEAVMSRLYKEAEEYASKQEKTAARARRVADALRKSLFK